MSLSFSRFTSPLRNNDKRRSPPTSKRDGGAEDAAGDSGHRSNEPPAPNDSDSTTTITTTTTPSENGPPIPTLTSLSSSPLSVTLSEALRNNPFGTTTRSHAVEVEAQTATSSSSREVVIDEFRVDLDGLNRSLAVLAELFPDVRIEVFRELLMRFDGNSRLQVCVEQLMKNKKQLVQGRWNIPVIDNRDNDNDDDDDDDDDNNNNHNNSNNNNKSAATRQANAVAGFGASALVPEELFRSETYRNTVKAVLCKEFNGLSRSTIEAVLAEVNFSYTRARPTLKELSRKGWRATISHLNPFRRRKDNTKDDSSLVIWERSKDGGLGEGGTPVLLPRLKQKTGSDELDQELHDTLIAPFLRKQRETQEYHDLRFATEINLKEATAESSLYECQCCLDDVTFEQVAVCSSETHIICFNCICRTLHEAIFGQGWDTSVDPERSTLRCIAPVSHGVCEGHLDPMLVKRAVLFEKAGSETYKKFEERMASEALLKSNLKLIRCPFCTYAEIDPVFHPSKQIGIAGKHGSSGGIRWRFRRGTLISMIITAILLLDLIPLLNLPFLILFLLYPQTLAAIARVSLQNLCLKSRSPRFTCKNPSCRQVSCMTCNKIWRDPHTCEEPLQQSLRITVEAARTAAVKRTCPRCNLSFVKSSGCNKLTCVCGYSMCYICRKALNGPSSRRLQDGAGATVGQRRPFPPAGNPGDEDNNAEEAGGGEEESGYKHFCEHFRVNPGTRCTECNKCELYFAEDEEAIARKAGEKAEREWRLRQASIANKNHNNNNRNNNNNNMNHQYYLPQKNTATTTTSNNNNNNRPGSSIFNFTWDPDSTTPPNPRHQPQPQHQHQHQPHYINPYQIRTSYNPPDRSWQYWLVGVWKEERWKWEIQGMVDKVAERIIIVDDIT